MADNIYNSNALTARLNRPGKKKKVSGGTTLIFPVINSQPGEGGYYSDLDTLSTSRTDNITAAEYSWRQLHEPIRVSGLEMIQNSGDAAKLKLVASKVTIAKKQMNDLLGQGIFSNGTVGGNTAIDGLANLLSTSTTHGGIAVADFSNWVAQSVNNSGTDRALSLDLMQQTWGACSEGSDVPTLIVGRQTVVDQLWSLFQPFQRLMSEEMASLGFKNVLTFNGAPVLVDSHATAKELDFLNEDYLFLAVHPERDMKQETIERLETSDSMLIRIFWAGNLCCNARRFQGILDDISVAS